MHDTTYFVLARRAASSPLRVEWTEANGWRIIHPQFTVPCGDDIDDARRVYKRLRYEWFLLYKDRYDEAPVIECTEPPTSNVVEFRAFP